MAGAVVGGRLADRIGRRRTLIVAAVVYVVGALGSAVALDSGQLIAARCTLGLAVGAASLVAPMYIAEHAPARIRGGTVTYNQLMITVGILAAYLTNFFLKDAAAGWRWMLGLGAAPGLVLLAAMFIVPSSPRWLMGRGRRDAARQVLRRTRRTEDVEGELDEIASVVSGESRVRLRDLTTGRMRPVLVVGLGLAVMQQFVGVNTVIYFSPTILTYTGLRADEAITQALLVGATNVAFTVLAVLLLDRMGRRALLLAGTAGLTVALIGLGAFFALPDLQAAMGWLAVVALVLYIASFAIGLGPVFWLMISEIFPLALRGRAMAICTSANWVANFLVSYFFLQLIGAIGQSWTFWLYAFLGALALVFFARRVPETRHRTLEQIEHSLGVSPR